MRRHSVSGRSGHPPVPGVRLGRPLARKRSRRPTFTGCKPLADMGAVMATTDKSKTVEQEGPISIRLLADNYRRAAMLLRESGQRGNPMSWAPFRLVAVHAIELYLTAFLLHRGMTGDEVRQQMGHHLGKRADAAKAAGLILRQRTHEHLVSLSSSKVYRISRYQPSELETASELNRLTATLDEVTHKTALAAAAVPSQSPVDR